MDAFRLVGILVVRGANDVVGKGRCAVTREQFRLLVNEAQRREQRDAKRKPGTDRTKDGYHPHYKGLIGELALAETFGLEVDLSIRDDGDGGADFILHTVAGELALDVKAAADPKWLFVKEYVCKPGPAYILAWFIPGPTRADDRAKLLGWEYGRELMKRPASTKIPGAFKNYWKRADQLRRMVELRELAR